MTALILALLLAQEPNAPRTPADPDSTPVTNEDGAAPARVSESGPPDSYADDDTRALVLKARDYRGEAYLALREYSVRASSEMSVGVRALLRDRTIFKCQAAVEVTWRRYAASDVRVLGARYAVPIAGVGPRVPDDIDDCASAGLFDPAADRFAVFGGLVGGGGSDFTLRHPLARGAESHYRYALGDTTRISLPSGLTVTLVELVVKPRRNDADLLSGSLWVDADSYAVVQAFVRPARPADLHRDFAEHIDDEDLDKVPGFLKPIEGEIRYIAIEYGLWEQRWWLPRLIAMEGVARVGRFARFPLAISQRYGPYQVVGDAGAPGPARLDSLRAEAEAYRDSLADLAAHDDDNRDISYAVGTRCNAGPEATCWCANDSCFLVNLDVPDSATLLSSPALPGDLLSDEDPLISEAELDELTDRIASIAPPPWQAPDPRFSALWDGSGLLRYNRVEGLAVGARADLDMGRLQAAGVARLGLAAFEPTAEITLSRSRYRTHAALSGYRRLAPVTRGDRSLGLGNSLNSLLFGRDDGDYFLANGAELILRPPEDIGGSWEVRLFAEGQRRARRETDFSLANTLGGSDFRPNIEADRANQAGASLVLRHSSGADPGRFRWGLEAFGEGSTGTFDFARPSLTLRMTLPLGEDVGLGLEGAAGASLGDLPAQSLWLLGGSASLRGYDGGALRGDAYWRGRAELALDRLPAVRVGADDPASQPAVRFSIFSDFGWAGDRSEWDEGDPLWSAGLGVSALDGLLRFDVARTLRSPIDWRVHMYLDGLL